jgi:hypothetical protein
MSQPSFRTAVLSVAVAFGASCAPAMLRAQEPTPLRAPGIEALAPTSHSPTAARGPRTTPDSAVASLAGPWRGTAAFPTTVLATAGAGTYQDDARLGAGKNVALMGVGAAAVVIGLLVGDDAGTGIAVGGGLLGLYGLYRFLK